jgi:lipoprotein Spr
MFLGSCKPSASVIVTSKVEAEKRGLYESPEKIELPKKIKAPKKEIVTVQKKESKKSTSKFIMSETEYDDFVIDNDQPSYLVSQLINTASDNLGINYRGGGSSKEGFDCSGLMYYTFKNFDITLPRSSHEMAKIGTKLNNNEIKKGDLVFFKTREKGVINHVGMVVEVLQDEIKFIHSSTSSGVIISSTKEPYYNKSFIQANRLF